MTCHRDSSLLHQQPKLRLAINSFCPCSLQNCLRRALADTQFSTASHTMSVQDLTGHIMRWPTGRLYKWSIVVPSLYLPMFLKAHQSQKLSSRRPNSRSSSSSTALDLECGYTRNDFFLHLLYVWKQPDYAKVKWIALAEIREAL